MKQIGSRDRSSRMSQRVLALAFAVCAAANGAAAAEVHWGYHGEIGPEYWGSLDPSFYLCSQGEEQTPINIALDNVSGSSAPALTFSYGVNNVTLRNNGHSVNAEALGTARWITLGGTRYDLVQFHPHWPSEHTVEGAHYPLEIHLVHRSAAGDLAVVGIFVTTGSTHAELDKYFRNLPATTGATRAVSNFDFRRLLPTNRQFYSYNGSLTTPDCREGVRWSVLRTAIQASATQIQRFRTLFSGPNFPEGNARPVQPLNDRDVLLVR